MGYNDTDEMPWSVTHIESFTNCPYLYANQYEWKTIKYESTPAMEAGQRAHQQLYLRQQRTPIPLPPELEPLEPMCRSFESKGTVHAELPIAITRNLTETGFYARDVWHRAKIDVALVLNGGTALAAFDWKNGNPNYEKPFQLGVYAVDLMIKFPEAQRVAVANVWLRTNQLGEVRRFTRKDDFQRLAADVFSRHDDIVRARKAGSWPKMPNPFCKGCKVPQCEHKQPARD